MTAVIPGGYTLWAKTVFQSPIWRKHPLSFKAFFWIVGNAAFTDGYTFKGYVLQRGQLVATYAEIADALSYCFNRAIIKPSTKEIRVILLWLQSEGMITVKPLTDGTSANKGRPSDLTRAYLGLLITVVNYDLYQDSQSYKGRDKGRPSDEQGQLRKEKEKKKTFSSSSDHSEVRLASLLLERITSRLPGFKQPDLQRWAVEIDRMVRIDKRPPEEIRRVIEWCQADDFWQNNILSAGKLRKQFDQLWAKMPRPSPTPDSDHEPPRPVICPGCGRSVLSTDMDGAFCIRCASQGPAHA